VWAARIAQAGFRRLLTRHVSRAVRCVCEQRAAECGSACGGPGTPGPAAERGTDMDKHARYRPATAALAAMAALLLAGCGASPAISGAAAAPATSSSVPASPGASGSGSRAVVPASALPFPVAVGNTWVYTSSVPSAGSASTVTNKILSVLSAPGGDRVTESYTSSLTSKTVHTIYVFHSDGWITFPLNQVSGGTLLSSSGGILLPDAADIASGRPYRSVLTLRFAENGRHLTEVAHITVQGAGTATVTVPAGTFTATIVEMTMAWSTASIPVSIQIRDWFATGTGTVKSEALIHEAGLNEVVSTEELQSFTKG